MSHYTPTTWEQKWLLNTKQSWHYTWERKKNWKEQKTWTGFSCDQNYTGIFTDCLRFEDTKKIMIMSLFSVRLESARKYSLHFVFSFLEAHFGRVLERACILQSANILIVLRIYHREEFCMDNTDLYRFKSTDIARNETVELIHIIPGIVDFIFTSSFKTRNCASGR